MKVRDVRIDEYVEVNCCDHCHGEPRECPDAKNLDRTHSVVDHIAEACSLLYRAHGALSRDVGTFERAALRDDLRDFLVRYVPTAVPL